MKKILLISDYKKRSLSFRIIERIFTCRSENFVTANEIKSIINDEKPNFIMLDVKIKPVNGMDMMSVLGHVDGNIRLRVAILETSIFKKNSSAAVLNPRVN